MGKVSNGCASVVVGWDEPPFCSAGFVNVGKHGGDFAEAMADAVDRVKKHGGEICVIPPPASKDFPTPYVPETPIDVPYDNVTVKLMPGVVVQNPASGAHLFKFSGKAGKLVGHGKLEIATYVADQDLVLFDGVVNPEIADVEIGAVVGGTPDAPADEFDPSNPMNFVHVKDCNSFIMRQVKARPNEGVRILFTEDTFSVKGLACDFGVFDEKNASTGGKVGYGPPDTSYPSGEAVRCYEIWRGIGVGYFQWIGMREFGLGDNDESSHYTGDGVHLLRVGHFIAKKQAGAGYEDGHSLIAATLNESIACTRNWDLRGVRNLTVTGSEFGNTRGAMTDFGHAHFYLHSAKNPLSVADSCENIQFVGCDFHNGPVEDGAHVWIARGRNIKFASQVNGHLSTAAVVIVTKAFTVGEGDPFNGGVEIVYDGGSSFATFSGATDPVSPYLLFGDAVTATNGVDVSAVSMFKGYSGPVIEGAYITESGDVFTGTARDRGDATGETSVPTTTVGSGNDDTWAKLQLTCHQLIYHFRRANHGLMPALTVDTGIASPGDGTVPLVEDEESMASALAAIGEQYDAIRNAGYAARDWATVPDLVDNSGGTAQSFVGPITDNTTDGTTEVEDAANNAATLRAFVDEIARYHRLKKPQAMAV